MADDANFAHINVIALAQPIHGRIDILDNLRIAGKIVVFCFLVDRWPMVNIGCCSEIT